MKNLFKFHKLNEQGQEKSKKIAELFESLCFELSNIWNNNNENEQSKEEFTYKNLVFQKLEESCFYSKKIIAIQELNQEKK